MRPLYVLLVFAVVSVLVVDARRRKTHKDHDGSTIRKKWQACLLLKGKSVTSTATLTEQDRKKLSSKFCQRVFKHHAKVAMCKAASAKPETERTKKEKKLANAKWCKYFVKHGKMPHRSGRRKKGNKGKRVKHGKIPRRGGRRKKGKEGKRVKHGKVPRRNGRRKKGNKGKRGSIAKMWKPCLSLKAKNKNNGTITLTNEESKIFNSPICKKVFAWSVQRAKCTAINGKSETSLTKEEKVLSKQKWCKRMLSRLRAKRRHHKVKHPRRSKTRHGAKHKGISGYMLKRRQAIVKCKQEISKTAKKDRKMKKNRGAFKKCFKKMMAKVDREDNGRCQPITKVYNASSPVDYAGRSVKPANDSEGCKAMCEHENIHLCRSAVFIDEANMCVLLMKLPKIALYGRAPSNTNELLRPCAACTTAIRFCTGTAPAQVKLNDKKGKRRSNRKLEKHLRSKKGLKHIEEGEKKKGKETRRRRQKKNRKLDNEKPHESAM